MATVQKKRPTDRTAERDPQVYHPLDRLRGIIRRYVVLEGVLSAALLFSLWFSLGLALDYGVFKTLGWDWARDGSWYLRLLALTTVLVLFVLVLVFRIVQRLTKEFSYSSLALVLERKFPKVLGDRLITAVQMADVEAMAKFGYSKDMIRATIAEARERVGKVPVREVFNWRRLWVMGFLAVGLLLGTVAVSYASYATATGSGDLYRFGWKFADVTSIFAERNVALLDTPWPRRAHIEFVGFPEDGELAIGREEKRPTRITVRAYRWVLADRKAPDGWRPLLWSDVTEKLVDRPVPQIPDRALGMIVRNDKSTAADGKLDPEKRDAITVDHLERWLSETDDPNPPEPVKVCREEVKRMMNSGTDPSAPKKTQDYEALQEVFSALVAKADDPSMGRTLRRLDIPKPNPEKYSYRDNTGAMKYEPLDDPGVVKLKYSGRHHGGDVILPLTTDNEFAWEVAGLKEDSEFVIKVEDYTSTPRRIRLIPPPSLKRLSRDQEEPAYLHHEPPQGMGYDVLKGKFQKVATKDLSLTGDRTVFTVPAGTELALTAEAYTNDDDKLDDNDRIVSAVAIPVTGRFPGMVTDDKGKPTQAAVPLAVLSDGRGFRIWFTKEFRLRDNVEFKVTWNNKYNVSATRSFLIQVMQDQPPVVEFAVETIRKQGNVYLVTPAARIPFNPDSFIKDDHGLSKVEYTFTYWAEDSDYSRGLRAKYAMRSLLDVPLPGGGPTGFMPRIHADNFRFLDKADDRRTGSAIVSEFDRQQRKLTKNTLKQFEQLLGTAKSEDSAPETVKKIELKNPDRDFFDLKALHDHDPPILNIAVPRGEVQTTYRMDLNIQATDNNVDSESGPVVARNAEPIRLRIISESDLLNEISAEEILLANRLDEAIAKVAAARKKYEFVLSNNGYHPQIGEEVDPVKVKAQDAFQDVEKARDIVQSLGREFQRLARECEINRVIEITQQKYNENVSFYNAVLSESSQHPKFPVTFPQALGLMSNVQNPLNAGQWAPLVAATDAATGMYKLEESLRWLRIQHIEDENKDKAKKDLLAVLARQAKIRNEVDGWRIRNDERLKFLYPTFPQAGVLSFNKGETKRLSQVIEWNQYPSDTIVVKLTASDPSITVPAELTLDFEKNTSRFEFDVKAGDKVGAFKITLTPAKGPPVETQLIVQ